MRVIFRTGARLCIYHLLVWSNLNFLHISQWITLPTQWCFALYSSCANLLHSLITWLMVSSLSPHSLHLLFCWVLSILALIWLVLMALFCVAIRRDFVSLLKFPFLSHFQVLSCEMLFISRLNRLYFALISNSSCLPSKPLGTVPSVPSSSWSVTFFLALWQDLNSYLYFCFLSSFHFDPLGLKNAKCVWECFAPVLTSVFFDEFWMPANFPSTSKTFLTILADFNSTVSEWHRFLLLFLIFRFSFRDSSYNWCHRHLHLLQLFQVFGKIQEFLNPFAFWLTLCQVFLLSVWILKYQTILCVSFSWPDSGLYIHHLPASPNFLLHNSQSIIFPTLSCLRLLFFWALSIVNFIKDIHCIRVIMVWNIVPIIHLSVVIITFIYVSTSPIARRICRLHRLQGCNNTPTHKKSVLILNTVRCWDSSSGALGKVDSPPSIYNSPVYHNSNIC